MTTPSKPKGPPERPGKIAPSKKPSGRAGQLAPISEHAIYPLSVFSAISGLDRWALREARRAGLRMVTVGKRKFVRGADFAEFLKTAADRESAAVGHE